MGNLNDNRASGLTRRYFGTDGIRGRAGETLTPELALRAAFGFGRQADRRYSSARRPVVVLGCDPRLSSPMLVSAVAAGLTLAGCDVLDLGIVPTPLVPLIVLQRGAAGGIMVTASHNPVWDNGIKFFGADGFKISADLEQKIEAVIERELNIAVPDQQHFGQVEQYSAADDYLKFLRRSVRTQANGHTLTIVLDCANGATSELAPLAFEQAGFVVHAINAEFDGARINVRSGATDMRALRRQVKRLGADLGLAFDGDGDRVLAVDANGEPVSGDRIIALLALNVPSYRKQGAVVMTQMTNLGVEHALNSRDIELVRTEVGDIKVLEAMRERKLGLGGEQSGHIIMLDLSTSGDGILTGLRLAGLVRKAHKPLAELVSAFKEYPQQLTNLPMRDKQSWLKDAALKRELSRIRRSYPEVRFYLRPSGTENLVRVLTESLSAEQCRQGNDAACQALNEWNER